jgi:hypothetical protein
VVTPDQCVAFYSPVKSSVSSLSDVANKENWEHAGEVDIHKILQMLDRDMEADAAAGELLVAIKEIAPLSSACVGEWGLTHEVNACGTVCSKMSQDVRLTRTFSGLCLFL